MKLPEIKVNVNKDAEHISEKLGRDWTGLKEVEAHFFPSDRK